MGLEVFSADVFECLYTEFLLFFSFMGCLCCDVAPAESANMLFLTSWKIKCTIQDRTEQKSSTDAFLFHKFSVASQNNLREGKMPFQENRSTVATKYKNLCYISPTLEVRPLHFNIHFEPCSMESVVPYLSTKQWNAKMHFIVGFYLIASGVLLCIYRHGKKTSYVICDLFLCCSENSQKMYVTVSVCYHNLFYICSDIVNHKYFFFLNKKLWAIMNLKLTNIWSENNCIKNCFNF